MLGNNVNPMNTIILYPVEKSAKYIELVISTNTNNTVVKIISFKFPSLFRNNWYLKNSLIKIVSTIGKIILNNPYNV